MIRPSEALFFLPPRQCPNTDSDILAAVLSVRSALLLEPVSLALPAFLEDAKSPALPDTLSAVTRSHARPHALTAVI